MADAAREEENAIGAEGKPARKRHDARWQCALCDAFQRRGKGGDSALTAQADIVAAIGSEGTAARVQLWNWSGIAYDLAAAIERQDAIAAAVEKERSLFVIDGKPAWIDNARVLAESAERLAFAIESKERAVSVAIVTGRTCEGEALSRYLHRVSALERALDAAAVDAQSCARCRRSQWTCYVGNERCDLFRQGEPLDQRGRAHLLEELGLKLFE